MRRRGGHPHHSHLRNRVEFTVDLEAPDYIENVEIFGKLNGHFFGLLSRNMKPITNILLSDAQARRVRERRGKLNITSKMIRSAR